MRKILNRIKKVLKIGKITAVNAANAVKDTIENLPPDSEKVVAVKITGSSQGCLQGKAHFRGRFDNGKWEDTGHFSKSGIRGHPSESFLNAMKEATFWMNFKMRPRNERLNCQKIRRAGVSVLPDDFSKDGIPLCLFTQASAEEASLRTPKPKGLLILPRTHILGGWKMSVRIAYDSTVLCEKDILLLMKVAGKNVGIGPWRKEKGGVFGRWSVKSIKQAQ